MIKIGNITVLGSKDFRLTRKEKIERERQMVKSIAINGDYPGIMATRPDLLGRSIQPVVR